MPPHTECGDLASTTALLECTASYSKEICRLIPPQKRELQSSCSHDSPSRQHFSLEFQASQIFLSSIPLSSILGTADIYLDDVWSGQLELVPHSTPWSQHGLNASTRHTLAILSTASVSMDLFILTLSNHTDFSDLLVNTDSKVEFDFNPNLASEKDGSSGAIISIASLAAVFVVVLVCSICFFLNRSARRPGFHMPSVLVNETTSDESNMHMDIDHRQENNRRRHAYERYELSTFSTGTTTTKSTWKDSDDLPLGFELQYEYQSRPQPNAFETRSSMIIPPNSVYTSSSSQTQAPGSETPKRRLSWHEDQGQAMNS